MDHVINHVAGFYYTRFMFLIVTLLTTVLGLLKRVTMFWSTLLAFAVLADALPQTTPIKGPGDNSLVRFGCSQVVIERLDP